MSLRLLALGGLMFAIANVVVWQAVFAPHVLSVDVLDVGKGDAVLVQSPSGTTVLLDAGPDASILRALGAALPYGKRRIDALIELANLPAAIGGVPEVLSRYQVAQLYRPGDLPPGTRLNFGAGVSIGILSLGIDRAVRVSYGAVSMTIASSSAAGVYISNGLTFETK